jgi:predicted RNase H-related nuclease YkuK (DUF458 family)
MNPTKGTLTLDQVVDDMIQYVETAPNDQYRVIIGSDSHTNHGKGTTTFVTAIIIHRVGKGARYYFYRLPQHVVRSLRQRIYTEASLSLNTCGELTKLLQERQQEWNLEVHVDVGEKGATKSLIKEVVGWITQSGYRATIKPDSFGASKVADRYTRCSS